MNIIPLCPYSKLYIFVSLQFNTTIERLRWHFFPGNISKGPSRKFGTCANSKIGKYGRVFFYNAMFSGVGGVNVAQIYSGTAETPPYSNKYTASRIKKLLQE